MQFLSADILIVGGGRTASMAAYTLSQENPRKKSLAVTAGSGHWDALSPLLPDEKEDWSARFQETLRLGAGQNDPALVRALCENGKDTLRQAKAMNRDNLNTVNGLTALRLFVQEGRVQGALCFDRKNEPVAVSAGEVILACGGYGEIYRLAPVHNNCGDAIGMAYYAGAAMADLEFGYFPSASDGCPLTLGGLIIDPQCRTNVPGLYAAGGCAAGVHGAGLLPGNETLAALVFGRLAGHALAESPLVPGAKKEALMAWAEETAASGDKDLSPALASIRQEMVSALQSGAGSVRNQGDIETALQTASHLQHELNELPPCLEAQRFSRLRLENDLIAARLTLLASMERRESVGVYRRSDHPEQAKTLYRVRLCLTGMLLFPEKESLPR